MSTTVAIILIAVILLAAVAAWAFLQRRTNTLRRRFGPEYDRAVGEYGNRLRAEQALEHRAERTEKYHIHSLAREEQQRFMEEWRIAQTRFVDDPALAIRDADRLVGEVMRQRGYPMADFDRRAEDLSVDHPHVIRNYRAAHDIAVADQRGTADTEDLRRGMVHYRELFDELLEIQPADMPERRR
jgi:hypothetical protein